MKYCSKCGCALAEEVFFCPACGVKSEAPVPASASNTVPFKGYTFIDKLPGLILLPLLFLAVLVAGSLTPMFFKSQNLENIIHQTCIFTVFGTGMLISARAKGSDLSIGSTAALSSVIIAANAQNGFLTSGIVLALIICLLIGAINGALTVYARIPSVLITLGTLLLFRGISFSLSSGNAINIHYETFTFGSEILVLTIILLAMAGLLYLLLYTTKLGIPMRQKINTNTKTIDFIAYIITSLLLGLGGLIMLSRLQTATPNLGVSYEIYALFVVFLCGSSIYFEIRPLLPIILVVACFIYTAAANIMSLLNMDVYTQTILIAALFIIALVCDRTYKQNIVSSFRRL